MPIQKQNKYKPHLKVNDISSLGRSHRVFGHKTVMYAEKNGQKYLVN